MINSRAIVGAPRKDLLAYGLFSVAEMRRPADIHWRNGVTWQNVCPDASSTYDLCVLPGALGVPATGISAPSPKTATAERSLWGATPFTVVVEIDCTPVGEFWNVADELVNETFTSSEEIEVAQIFASGTVGGTPNLQFPHLASTGELLDTADNATRATLQLATGNLGPTGGGSLDVVEALGRMEQALGACIRGRGVIHVPATLISHLKANHLLEERDGRLYTCNGHLISVSPGYPGSSPAGVLQEGVSWMYGTGPVFVYSSNGRFLGNKTDSLDREVNTLKRIYERTYVVGYDCCLFAVPVSTGGVITGAINSAV